MKLEFLNSPQVHNRNTGYSQAVSVTNFDRLVFVSGQIPVRTDGSVPDMFAEQAELVWHNVEAQLREVGMGLENIIKHTTYLSDRKYRDENSAIRRKVFGTHEAALTVIIAGIFDEQWLLEIEVEAAA